MVIEQRLGFPCRFCMVSSRLIGILYMDDHKAGCFEVHEQPLKRVTIRLMVETRHYYQVRLNLRIHGGSWKIPTSSIVINLNGVLAALSLLMDLHNQRRGPALPPIFNGKGAYTNPPQKLKENTS